MKRKLLTLLVFAFLCTSNIFAQWNPRPGWKDSYQAAGFCWCDSNFDHGVANKTFPINNTEYSVVDICDELKKHPNYRAYQQGDPIYNDIQCGNGPVNDAPDEPGCPGRVDLGPDGCDEIGPGWDIAWLSSRPRFNGDGGGDSDGDNGDPDLGEIGSAGTGGSGEGEGPKLSVIFPTLNKRLFAPATFTVEAEATDADGVKEIQLIVDGQFIRTERFAPYLWNDRGQDNALNNLPVKNYLLEIKAYDNKGNVTAVDVLVYVIEEDNNQTNTVSILGQTINKYVSSENGSASMNCNRNSVGTLEQFIMEPAANGTVSFKGNNGKYVSSENGGKPMNCNRNAVGSWERFTLESLGGNVYAIKGNNGKYVSHENGNKAMNCNRNAVGTWERFVIEGVSASRIREITKNSEASYSVDIYPLPIQSDNITLNISLSKKVSNASAEIIDLKGNRIASKNLGSIASGTKSIEMNDLNTSKLSTGLYILKVRLDNTVITKKIARQ